MIYSSATYFIAIRSQFRMRRTYRKQRQEGEAKTFLDTSGGRGTGFMTNSQSSILPSRTKHTQ